jgi:predicted site-specific integrase-resolvase
MDLRVINLEQKRNERKRTTERNKKPLDTRVSELEADVLRVIDAVVDLDRQIDQQRKSLRKLLKLLRENPTK